MTPPLDKRSGSEGEEDGAQNYQAKRVSQAGLLGMIAQTSLAAHRASVDVRQRHLGLGCGCVT